MHCSSGYKYIYMYNLYHYVMYMEWYIVRESLDNVLKYNKKRQDFPPLFVTFPHVPFGNYYE